MHIKRKFCSQLTRKHVSNAFFNAELESELSETLLKPCTFFKSDADKNAVMSSIEVARVAKFILSHHFVKQKVISIGNSIACF